MRSLRSAVLVVILGFAAPAAAAPITIDFEGLADQASVGSLLGATFSGAATLTAGLSLNEIDFPPVSGEKVIYNTDTELRIDFDEGVSSVAAYLTYVGAALTMSAYDAGGNLLGSVQSLVESNFASSGNAPNELLQLAFDSIAYVTLSNGFAGSFVLDDLTFDTIEGGGDPNPVPEPGTVSLVLLGAALAARKKLMARRQSHA